MKKIAVFPGSFSPFTLGHKSIVERTLPLFDKLIIAIGINSSKTNKFDSEKNQKWIQSLFASENKIVLVKSHKRGFIFYIKKIFNLFFYI